jgi:hypothetical protein
LATIVTDQLPGVRPTAFGVQSKITPLMLLVTVWGPTKKVALPLLKSISQLAPTSDWQVDSIDGLAAKETVLVL